MDLGFPANEARPLPGSSSEMSGNIIDTDEDGAGIICNRNVRIHCVELSTTLEALSSLALSTPL